MRNASKASVVALERAREAGVIRPGIGPDDIRRLSCGVVYAVRAGAGYREDEVDLYLDVLLGGLRSSSG